MKFCTVGILALVAFAAPSFTQGQECQNITGVIGGGDFSVINSFITDPIAQELLAILSNGTYTLFLPSDALVLEALTGLPRAPTPEWTIATLATHVVPGSYPAAALTDGQVLTNILGDELTVAIADDVVTVAAAASNASVATADAYYPLCDDSVIHTMNGVLIPDRSIDSEVPPVFVVGATTDDNTTMPADMDATNTADNTTMPTAMDGTIAANSTTNSTCISILAAVANETDISAIATAVSSQLDAATLAELQNDETGYTIFTPDNAASQALLTKVGSGDVKPEDIPTLLQTHMVPTAAMSTDLKDGMELTTLAGNTLTVNIVGTAVTVTGPDGVTVNVIRADVQGDDPASVCGGSVVHVIDGTFGLDPDAVAASTDAASTDRSAGIVPKAATPASSSTSLPMTVASLLGAAYLLAVLL